MRRDGYVVFRGVVPQTLVATARDAIEHDLATAFDPAQRLTYEHTSYCPTLREAPPITDLLGCAAVQAVLASIFEPTRLRHEPGQIAVRWAREVDRAIPMGAHIDGVPHPNNGLPPAGGIRNFTLLLGVYLTPIVRPFTGNLVVWPRSHHVYESYFRGAREAARHLGQPRLPLGEPVHLMAEPGDVVLAHYQLGHVATRNMGDVTRLAVYFRMALDDVAERSLHYLTDMFDGWWDRRARSSD